MTTPIIKNKLFIIGGVVRWDGGVFIKSWERCSHVVTSPKPLGE
nr:MAG TPA: hypothetical protein [Caudoviricetes sp.]